MKKLLTLISFTIMLIACNNTNKEKSNTATTVADVENQTDDELKTIEQNGKSFYDWYFKNEFPNCDFVKDKNGKTLLDTISYFRTLRKLGTISEKFIDKEKERMQICAEFVSTIDFSEFEENEDIYGFEEYCSHFYYMYWIKSQEPPDNFSAKNIKKIDENRASIDIYTSYDDGKTDYPLSTVILEKEQNIWKITEIKFTNHEETKTAKANDFTGRWLGGIVYFNIAETSLTFFYHGQCAYVYPIKKISDTQFEMIWERDMDCKFDNGTKETFGLDNIPEIGKPFAKYTLKNNILYAEYYYKEWVEKYTEQVEDVFTDKYFRKNENE